MFNFKKRKHLLAGMQEEDLARPWARIYPL
jgi:hypothetical protein